MFNFLIELGALDHRTDNFYFGALTVHAFDPKKVNQLTPLERTNLAICRLANGAFRWLYWNFPAFYKDKWPGVQ